MAHHNSSITLRGICGWILCAVLVSAGVLRAQSVSEAAWGFTFNVPKGWVCEHDATGAVLGHSTVSGMILVLPHTVASEEELVLTMQQGLEEENVALYPSGEIKKGKGSVYSAPYEGLFQGQEVRAVGYGTFSSNGGGAYVIAISTPDGFSKDLSRAAEALAGSVKQAKVDAGTSSSSLAGIWVTMTKSTETTLALAPNGQFSTGYVAEYGGLESGQWGLAREDHSSGRWTASGTREQGTITLVYGNGKRETIQYRVHVERGEVYWNEYWFNGDLYGRRR